MTDITERLAEIEVRVEAATEGPWRFDPEGESQCGEPQCCFEYWDNRIWGADRVLAESHMLSEADAEFIAHARTDVPWLIEQLRELQDEMERLQPHIMIDALYERDEQIKALQEQVRQRDEVIERVRAAVIGRTIPYEVGAVSLVISEVVAALEGDGR